MLNSIESYDPPKKKTIKKNQNKQTALKAKLPSFRAEANFEAKLNIISQIWTLGEKDYYIVKHTSRDIFLMVITVLQCSSFNHNIGAIRAYNTATTLFTNQCWKSLEYKLQASQQKPQRQSFLQRLIGSPNLPAYQWCRKAVHHPVC